MGKYKIRTYYEDDSKQVVMAPTTIVDAVKVNSNLNLRDFLNQMKFRVDENGDVYLTYPDTNPQGGK